VVMWAGVCAPGQARGSPPRLPSRRRHSPARKRPTRRSGEARRGTACDHLVGHRLFFLACSSAASFWAPNVERVLAFRTHAIGCPTAWMVGTAEPREHCGVGDDLRAAGGGSARKKLEGSNFALIRAPSKQPRGRSPPTAMPSRQRPPSKASRAHRKLGENAYPPIQRTAPIKIAERKSPAGKRGSVEGNQRSNSICITDSRRTVTSKLTHSSSLTRWGSLMVQGLSRAKA
jgi:hypothetical protein